MSKNEKKSVLDKIVDWWERFGCSFCLGMACWSTGCFVSNVYEKLYSIAILDVILMVYWIYLCNHEHNSTKRKYLYMKDRNEVLNTFIEMKQDLFDTEQDINKQLLDSLKFWENKANEYKDKYENKEIEVR